MNWRCLFRHNWRFYQEGILTEAEYSRGLVLAWKQCERCAKSKLIHILK